MNALLPTPRRVWIPAIAGLALLIVGAALVLLNPADRFPFFHIGKDATDFVPAVPQSPDHVKWTVKTFPARLGSKAGPVQKRAVAPEGTAVGATVKDVVDAVLLDRGKLKGLGGLRLAPGVEAALMDARLGAPAGAKTLLITRRVARIGIDPLTVRRASAEVSVGFKAHVEGRSQRYLQRSTLWLEKTEGKWQVIAFAGERFEVKAKPDRKDKGSDKARARKSASKKGRG